ncbi:acetoin utilization protein AcuC [Lichenicoccus sp.]|uniref:acetoin utilization protein AcuC n=1 Tax=Lichenicoccus sp. TaxID=2781899 RepID=UPI003D146249
MHDVISAAPILIGSEIYRHSSFGPRHPLAVPRVSVAIDLVRTMGWLNEACYRAAPVAEREAVLRYHAADYVDALFAAERDQAVSAGVQARYRLGVGDNPVYPEMYRRSMTGAGGLMLAARLTGQHWSRTGETRIVHCLGGGTHHGRPDRAAGFCYLNDIVLALMVWREFGLRRIAYVDIDAHHGDGVQDAFAEDPDVLTLSIHEAMRWPLRRVEAGGDLRGSGLAGDRAGGAARNFPVPAGLNDTEMRLLVDAAVLPLVRVHRPDAIFLQCGADALEEDPLSRLALSNNAHIEVASKLRDLAAERGIPLIVSGGGGYNPYSVGRCWACVWAALNAIESAGPATQAAEAVLRRLHYPRAAGRNPPLHWLTTLRDAPREGPVRDAVRYCADQAMKRP